MTTKAKTIATMFDNDGQVFENGIGLRIEDVCDNHSMGRVDRSEPHDVRYVFGDGSWLAIVGDCWFTDDDADGVNCYWPGDVEEN